MYNYNNQFQAMLNALMSGGQSLLPDAATNKAFKDSRLKKALKALRCRNVLMPATGSYLAANSNASFTVFTQPLGYDVIVVGASISSDQKPVVNTFEIISGELRVRPPEPLSINYIQPQKAFAPATYSIYFPAPFLLRAGEHIATDFGFNAPEANEGVSTAEIQIVYFAVQVLSCLTDEDLQTAEQMKTEIQARQWQRRLLFPCRSNEATGLLTGTSVEGTTRPLSATALVTGWSIAGANPGNVRLSLSDTALQYSLTTGKFVKSPNLFWAYSRIEPSLNGPYYSFFRLPVPHLLRPGSQMQASMIAGLNGAAGASQSISFVFELLLI